MSTEKLNKGVYNSFIHNSQKLEMAQIFTNRKMDKQNVVYSYIVTQLYDKKELIINTCNSMDESKTLCWLKEK